MYNVQLQSTNELFHHATAYALQMQYQTPLKANPSKHSQRPPQTTASTPQQAHQATP
jgi:hypothetical protein